MKTQVKAKNAQSRKKVMISSKSYLRFRLTRLHTSYHAIDTTHSRSRHGQSLWWAQAARPDGTQ